MDEFSTEYHRHPIFQDGKILLFIPPWMVHNYLHQLYNNRPKSWTNHYEHKMILQYIMPAESVWTKPIHFYSVEKCRGHIWHPPQLRCPCETASLQRTATYMSPQWPSRIDNESTVNKDLYIVSKTTQLPIASRQTCLYYKLEYERKHHLKHRSSQVFIFFQEVVLISSHRSSLSSSLPTLTVESLNRWTLFF